ncbi:organ-specific protein P4-like [Cucurbita maxima]|uniref:Organ-specific protein P4-like n=1 Tax=Cucurbita maxima TaxID=3661 RepID=A0A6J1I8Q9_CUCMA|nr:organ-specific protein P4-like [Cucurbita maxima]
MKMGAIFGITLLLLLMFVNNIESRHEPGERWSNVEAKEDSVEDKQPENEKRFVKDIEPRPSATFYPKEAEKKSFFKDVEPRPSATFYSNDNVKTLVFDKDIEPRPSATFYPNDNVKTILFDKDIEPRPSLTSYPSITAYPHDLNPKISSTDCHDEADIQLTRA